MSATVIPSIIILGRGKLASALERIFTTSFTVIKLSRTEFDARHPESVDAHLKAINPVYVFNTVVAGGLDACAADPIAALAVNTLFPLHLSVLSRSLGFTLVHFSTDSVFCDAQALGPCVESSPVMPPNIYGYTKFGADTLIPMHTQQYFIYRLPVMFGPCPVHSQFLERMVDRMIAGETVRVADDTFSHAVYSLDVAQAIKSHLLQKPESGLYHLAGKEKASLYDLAFTVAQHLDCVPRIHRGSAVEFAGQDYKNNTIHLASVKLPPLRSWRESLPIYCKCDILSIENYN